MMIKGNNPENIKIGSTLSTDEFASDRFDFMLSNPPYGKSWASEQKNIKDNGDVIDPRFKVGLTDYWGIRKVPCDPTIQRWPAPVSYGDGEQDEISISKSPGQPHCIRP